MARFLLAVYSVKRSYTSRRYVAFSMIFGMKEAEMHLDSALSRSSYFSRAVRGTTCSRAISSVDGSTSPLAMHSRCEKSPLWLTVLVLLAYFQAAVCAML